MTLMYEQMLIILEKQNDIQGHNHDTLLKKWARNKSRQKRTKPNLGGKQKIRAMIKERALQNTKGDLSHYFTESKSCLDIYGENRADGASTVAIIYFGF